MVFGILLNNVAGALWGSVALAIPGIIAWAEVPSVFFGWLVGNIVVCIALVPLALYFLTPSIKNHYLFVHHYWD